MITLLDYSQIVVSSCIEFYSRTKEPVSIDLVRHVALNSIVFYKKKFNTNLDSMIICCDGHNYWRKKVFPQYKQNRKIGQEADKFDWDTFYQCFNTIKQEMKTELPFRVIEVPGCEADDVIAVLSQILSPSQDIVIISSDKDLIQIQDFCKRVKQWSPYHKKYIDSRTNNYTIFEHIVRGDAGDGIPNIISDDDCYVNAQKRARPMRSKLIEDWQSRFDVNQPEHFCPDIQSVEKFKRNRLLIDLQMIPEEIKAQIHQEWNTTHRSKASVFTYLVKHKLKKIMESGGF
jgi:hypothetical protein